MFKNHPFIGQNKRTYIKDIITFMQYFFIYSFPLSDIMSHAERKENPVVYYLIKLLIYLHIKHKNNLKKN